MIPSCWMHELSKTKNLGEKNQLNYRACYPQRWTQSTVNATVEFAQCAIRRAKMEFYKRAALFLAFVGCATSLSCYTCTDSDLHLSTDTSACRDPFDRNATHPFVIKRDCADVSQIAPEATVNAGISQFDTCLKVTNTGKIINTFSRTCCDSSQCPVRNGCYSNGVGVTACCCNTDYCNDGAALAFSRAVISTVVFVAFSLTA